VTAKKSHHSLIRALFSQQSTYFSFPTRIIEMDTNLRPAFMDNLPKVTIADGLITANGLFRHGYLLAPAVVENILAQVLQNSEPVFDDLLQRHR